jgi:UMF1 family MFS transporter
VNSIDMATSLSVTGEIEADRRGRFGWSLFEFARSPYLSLVYIFVFPPYFAATIVGDPVKGQAMWGLANTIGGLAVAILAPIVGAVSDRTGARKPWLGSVVLIMSVACCLLWWAMPGAKGGLSIGVIMAMVVLLTACFQFTDVFHNSMLPSIASEQRIAKLSGVGIATGNFGTFVALSIMLCTIALPAAGITFDGLLPSKPVIDLDLSAHEHERIAGPIAGIWFIVFTLPLLLWTPDRAPTGVSIGTATREGLARLAVTLRHVRKVKNVALYLIARMLYTDGSSVVIAYTGIYAVGLFGWDLPHLLIFAIGAMPFCMVGGIVGGWIDSKIGSKPTLYIWIVVTLLAMAAIVTVGKTHVPFVSDVTSATPLWSAPYFNTLAELVYLGTVALLAISITGIYASSRTLMARISPPSMMNQFFGLYALSGTATAFLGHALVSFFTREFNSQRIGFASTVLLIVAGGILLWWVREERSEAPAV